MKKTCILVVGLLTFSFAAIAQSDTTKKKPATSTVDTKKDAATATLTVPGSTSPNPNDSQNAKGNIQAFVGKTYIFDANFALYRCDAVGDPVTNLITIAYRGYLFKVVDVYTATDSNQKKTTTLVIKFDEWSKKDFNKRLLYNIDVPGLHVKPDYLQVLSDSLKKTMASQDLTNENSAYFQLDANDFATVCSEYTSPISSTVTFGTFTMPFKFRPTKSLFSSDLTLGTVAYFNLSVNDHTSHGLAVGISISSVTLDSLSTNGKYKSSSERPALTPSLGYVFTYKGISFTAGVGFDYINKTTDLEKAWIFNGKPWFGFGIGLNLFGPGNSGGKTTANSSQSQ